MASKTKPQVASPQDFKKKHSGAIMQLPSGFNVRARRVSLRAFLQSGSVPNPLLPIVEEALAKGKGADVQAIMGKNGEVDIDMINEMYDMVNQVVCSVLIEPKVNMVPTLEDMDKWNENNPTERVAHPDDLRDDDLLYVDELEDEDKMFLFQWASGGTDDIATFREEAKQQLVALEQGQNSEAATKQADGAEG